MPTSRTDKAEPQAKTEAPPAAPPEGDKAEPQAKGEMEFHGVEIDGKNFNFVPGPAKKRPAVLKAWCEEYCEGRWNMMAGSGRSWIFELPGDARAFRKAWCSRVNPAPVQPESEDDDE